MQEEVIDGIVTCVQDYSDNTKLLTILSSEGKILVNAKGVNKAASKLKSVATPFCFAEFSLITKNQTTLAGAHLYDNFFSLSTNYTNYILASAILDLINKTTDDSYILKKLFVPCVNLVKNLCYQKQDGLIYFNAFLINYLNICGYKLNTKTCAGCGKTLSEFYFNPYDASILCANCKQHQCQSLSAKQIEFVEKSEKECSLSSEELLALTKNLANAIYCLLGIKLKIEDVL